MNLPNKLTVIRIVLAPLFLLLTLVEFPFHNLAAGLVFGAAALTDMFDGKIARSRGLITNLGKFLDPLADKMLTTAAFLSFLATGHLDVWALMVVLTREFMVTSVRLVAAKDGTVIAANFWGKLKTVMQFVAILFELAALEFATWQTGLLAGAALPAAVFDIPLVIGYVLLWISVVSTAVSGVQYVWVNRKFFKDAK
ncbi:MAG: CDP-diacylglycerol--glycerol-3-phosphate 3-phosphatidyltransferase [Clostridia bacterium]|nr:CDP-diacylglycerol--glycerol-3-phosphate 3-phosphatidyltransferase [Clostridia bacterium]